MTFEWAHIHDTNPGDIYNYVSLCKSCHNKYDGIGSHSSHLKGEDHGQAKLTEQKVLEIRARYADGNDSYSTLAEEYSVGRTTICHIVRGETWKHSIQMEELAA